MILQQTRIFFAKLCYHPVGNLIAQMESDGRLSDSEHDAPAPGGKGDSEFIMCI